MSLALADALKALMNEARAEASGQVVHAVDFEEADANLDANDQIDDDDDDHSNRVALYPDEDQKEMGETLEALCNEFLGDDSTKGQYSEEFMGFMINQFEGDPENSEDFMGHAATAFAEFSQRDHEENDQIAVLEKEFDETTGDDFEDGMLIDEQDTESDGDETVEPAEKKNRTEVSAIAEESIQVTIARLAQQVLTTKQRRPEEGVGTKSISFTFKRRVVEAYRLAKAIMESPEYSNIVSKLTSRQKGTKLLWIIRLWQLELLRPHYRNVKFHHLAQIEEWDRTYTKSPETFRGSKFRASSMSASKKYQPIESELHLFCQQKRSERALIMFEDVLGEACSIALKLNIARAVSPWFVLCFMKRKKWRLKVVKRHTSLAPAQVAEKAQSFHMHVYRVLRLQIVAVINFDEIPMSVCGRMGSVRTVAKRGENDVDVDFDISSTKRFCSIVPIVGCKFNAEKNTWEKFLIKTLIILIGEPGEKLKSEVFNSKVRVVWTKKGVMNSQTMETVVAPLIRSQLSAMGIPNSSRALVILDSAKSHTTNASVNAFYRMDLPVSVIPGGMTSNIQWIDTYFAGNYRQEHFRQYLRHVREKGTHKFTAAEKRQLVSNLVASSVDAVFGNQNVVAQFASLGYTDPTKTSYFRLAGYSFQPPAETAMVADENKLVAKLAGGKKGISTLDSWIIKKK